MIPRAVLEAAAPADVNTLVVIVVRFIGARDGRPLPLGKLRGFDVGSRRVQRKASESEETLKERAIAIAKKERGPKCGALVLLEDRESENAQP